MAAAIASDETDSRAPYVRYTMAKLACVAFCLVFMGCRAAETVAPPDDSCLRTVVVSPLSLSLAAGDSATVRAIANRRCPLVTLDPLRWRSSDTSVAVVHGVAGDSAIVRAVRSGTTSIIAAGAPNTDAASAALIVTVR